MKLNFTIFSIVIVFVAMFSTFVFIEKLTSISNGNLITGFYVICEEGQIRNCPGQGICNLGNQVCINDTWSACDVSPQEEVCNDNLDNDCDGITDENCLCIEGETQPCGPNLGICKDNRPIRTCRSGQWSECEGGVTPVNETGQYCSDNLDNDCDGLTDLEDSECIFINPCNDRQRNYDETGVDCGGSCSPCQNICRNGILDAGEEKVNVIINARGTISDCGGNCPACPTCSDGIQNQNEEDIDCGPVCNNECQDQETPEDSDNDGLSDYIELQQGTDPNAQDTDNDGILDGEDPYPLCPNNTCNVAAGEDSENCPEDCKTSFPWFIIIFPLIMLIGLLIAYYLIKRTKKKKEKKPPKLHPYFIQETSKRTYRDSISEELKKIK